MKRIVERHIARLRRARNDPRELDAFRDRLLALLYPAGRAELRRVRNERVPADVPDWLFEAELRRSGLWEIMEHCYPSPLAQAQ